MNLIRMMIFIYIYNYTDRYNIKRLRCYDINCKGTAKLNKEGFVEIVNQCGIKYDKHNCRLKEINWHKIKNNLVTNKEIKDYSIQKL